MASRYWIGNGGSWSDTAHWSTSSGGVGGAAVPTSSDDVFFDANSFSSSGQIVSVSGATRSCASLTLTGATNAPSFSVTSDLQIFGSATLISACTIYGNAWLSFRGSGSQTITSNGLLISSYVKFRSGSYTLTDAFATTKTLYLTGSSSLATGGYAVTAIAIQADSSGTFDLGASTLTSQIGWLADTSLTVIAGTSTINITSSNPSAYFYGGGRSYATVNIAVAGSNILTVYDSSTFGSLALSSTVGGQIKFQAGTTQTITTAFAADGGTAGAELSFRSTTAGTQYTLSKSSGTVNATYLDLQDAAATGGATWNASSSVDSGNNTGWSVIGSPRLYPSSISGGEVFGSPTITLAPLYIYPSAISGGESFGTFTLTMNITGPTSISTGEAVSSPTITQSDPPAAPAADWSALGREDEKRYIYRVYTASGTFVGIWPDVKDDFEFTQPLFTPGTTTTVLLARSAQTKKEVRGNLLTETGDAVTTEAGDHIVVNYETTNNVGDGTDVVEGYMVDVYVYYGDFGYLLTEAGDVITTEAGERILVATGAPMGRRVFSGFILDYEAEYGTTQEGVTVTLASHGWELSNEEVLDGSDTNVTMSSTSPEQVVKNVLDTNPGKMTYAAGTLDTTGVTDTFKFQLNTKLEAIQSAFDRTPDGYYWFGDVAESYIYMKQASTTADHTFILGKHIKSLKMKKSIESLVNTIYFVGGEVTPGTPSSVLYKKYTDATSLSTYRKGLQRITDRRYTLAASAALRAGKSLDRYKDPIFSSPLVISSSVYDIESIRLGQTVQFRGFNNYIDELPPLLIVNYGYKRTEVTLDLGELQERQFDALAAAQDALDNEQYETLPNAPS